MSIRTKHALPAVLLLGAMLAGAAGAQDLLPFGPVDYEQPLQLFAPVELGLDFEVEHERGYFVNLHKVYWGIDGERVVVGDPNIQRETNPVWYDRLPNVSPNPNQPFPPVPLNQLPLDPATGQPLNPDSGPPGMRDVINRPLRLSGLRSTVPDAEFDFGDRYELGFAAGGDGWMVGILEGPRQDQTQVFGPTTGLRHPLGEVYIAFDYEPGLMHGWLDVQIGAFPPGYVLLADVDGDGVLDGDGIADDMDDDAQHGPIWIDLMTPGQIPETDTDIPPDYDDLVELPTAFNNVLVRNSAKTSGVELMRSHVVDNRHFMAKNQSNYIELYYGARYLQFDDTFFVSGIGGPLGNSFWNTQIENNLVGPQVGARWLNKHGRWNANAQGRFMFGYNVSRWNQDGIIGDGLVPGDVNNPLYLGTTTFRYGRRDDDFSPVAEMRLEIAYQLAKSVALKAGWTGTYVGNVYRASTHVQYRLPDMGFIEGNPEHVIINGLTLGVELNH
jgi:hypothetical protein